MQKHAEEMGKLESSDRLNLEADNAGLGGGAAGVSILFISMVKSRNND